MNQCAFRLQDSRCDRVGVGRLEFCEYHAKGGKKLWEGSFYSFRQLQTVDPRYHKAEKGDFRVDESTEVCSMFDGGQWRRLCTDCHHLARPIQCTRHSLAPDRTKQSMACMFFDALEAEIGQPIQHNHWDHTSSEVRIPGTFLRVDGYMPHSNVVIEFLGDYFHGNPAVFRSQKIHPTLRVPFGQVYEQTMQRMQRLIGLGYQVFYIWESQYLAWKTAGGTMCLSHFITAFASQTCPDPKPWDLEKVCLKTSFDALEA